MRARYVIASVLLAAIIGITGAVLAVDKSGELTQAKWVADALLNTGDEINLAERDALAKRIDVSESDTYSVMGKTLYRAKLMMNAEDIEDVLQRQQDANHGLKRATDESEWTERVFADRPMIKIAPNGPNNPPWWKPFDAKAHEYATWSTHYPNQPRTWIHLQVCESDEPEHKVYLRIESD